MDYFKDFDGWITKKKEYNYKTVESPMFRERDIWWTSIGINIGFEEDGKHEKFIRPVLVLRKFNRELFFGIPMSTKNKENPYYIQVTVGGKTVSCLTSQVRVFSSKRLQDKLVELDINDFNKVKKEVSEVLFFSPSPKRRSRG